MRTEYAAISHAELILHDVRLRILYAASNEALTTKQLAERLPDIPQATLYRHVKTLLEHAALEVVEERAVRGTIETTYRTPSGAARLSREEFSALPLQEHQKLFAFWLGQMKIACDEYLAQPKYNTEDGMTYFMAKLKLTPEQRNQLRLDMIELLHRYEESSSEEGGMTSIGIAILPEVSR